MLSIGTAIIVSSTFIPVWLSRFTSPLNEKHAQARSLKKRFTRILFKQTGIKELNDYLSICRSPRDLPHAKAWTSYTLCRSIES